MKKIILLLSILLITGTSLITAQDSRLTGKWTGLSEGERGIMTFDKDGYASFTIEGETIGGKKYKADGILMTMTYEYDDQVVPHTIDFVISTAEENIEIIRMKGIYKFVNDRTMIFNMKFDDSERPLEFNKADPNQIILTKI